MAVLQENIDPNGDTLIIFSYLAVPTQSADEPVPAEEQAATAELLAVEEPAAVYERDHIDGHSTISSIDRTTHCHEVASRRARAMFQSDYRETRKTEVDGLYHWEIGPLFDPEAFRIVMQVIHVQAQDLPDEVTLQMIVSIAEIVDDLQCHDALSFFVKVWINRLSESVPSHMCDELVQWIFVASVFGLDEKFKQATRVAIMCSTGPIDLLGLPMRPDIVGMFTTISPFRNQSLSSALEAVRHFDSPSLYLPSEDISHYPFDHFDSSFQGSKEDVWVLQKDAPSSSRRKKKDRGLFDEEDDDEELNKTPRRLKSLGS
ncbi:het-d [Fusarium subglutinans]|uniref:Het-d n=1 Tax=Gibberella subglutinans TaxID=42677 RepID=A0A8H5P223_GIBSU|nr:het-d [Fusarium subglutinans]KAF5585263.1 het-d [Fusarium subglutinans]